MAAKTQMNPMDDENKTAQYGEPNRLVLAKNLGALPSCARPNSVREQV